LQVGLVSFVLGASLLVGFLTGGVLADRMDRRRLILLSSAGVATAFALFTLNTALPADYQLLGIYLIVAVGGAIEGIGETALTAATPALVAPDQLAAAGGLIAVTSQLGAIAGPALGGVVTATGGLDASYGLATLAILITTAVLARLRPLPPSTVDKPPAGVLAEIAEGFSFVRRNRLVASVLLIDLFATGFGIPQTVFPQMVAEHFHGGPGMVGLLAAAPATGALLASLSSGWTGRVRRSGAALIIATIVLALTYIGFGLSGHLVVAMIFLALAGGVDCVSEILRRALLQRHTPDHLQGRVNSLWLAQSGTSYSLGSTTAGFTAGLFGPALAMVGAGALCLVSVSALAASTPELRRATLLIDAPDDEDRDMNHVAS
jgi:MFS transporter, ENTS family, enterobactin (siderophore) exporter